jgi:hypothetical protein
MILLLLLFEKNGFSETSTTFKKEFLKKLLKYEQSAAVINKVDWRGRLETQNPLQLVSFKDS